MVRVAHVHALWKAGVAVRHALSLVLRCSHESMTILPARLVRQANHGILLHAPHPSTKAGFSNNPAQACHQLLNGLKKACMPPLYNMQASP